MKVKMELRSDTIFGNGTSIPGAEDISVLTDEFGFPYFKGGTMKGIFREELIRLLKLEGRSDGEIKKEVSELLGNNGDDHICQERKMIFSDFKMSENVRNIVIQEVGADNSKEILDILSNLRTFTKINEEGIVEEGTLRIARCINKGLVFYSDIKFCKQDEELVEEVLGMIKYIGTMRNRGFGNVKFSVAKEG
jgi:CRISPR-associated protein Csx10